MGQSSIEKLTMAEKWLAEAKTLEDLKQIHDIAIAAEAYARAHKLGLQSENHAREIKFLAARRIGELAPAIPKKETGRGKKSVRISDTFPDRQRLSEFRKLAAIPENEFRQRINELKEKEERITYHKLLRPKNIAKEEEERVAERLKELAYIEIRKGDFKKVLADLKEVDAIITDPPYSKEYLNCFSELSAFAQKTLKNDGFLIVYSGQYHLPEVLKRLSEHLTYVWTFCLYHKGKFQLVNQINIMCGWKPILIFSKGHKKLRFSGYDVVVSEEREKYLGEWQQSESSVRPLIEIFTKPGDLVVDPFAGTGTFLKVAKEMGRNAIGAEIK